MADLQTEAATHIRRQIWQGCGGADHRTSGQYQAVALLGQRFEERCQFGAESSGTRYRRDALGLTRRVIEAQRKQFQNLI